jgi:hypothetical protein
MEKFIGEFSPQKLTIPLNAFEDLLKFHSNKTVGKIMKRIEICDDKEVMKSQIKELLYEQYRDLGDLIFALNYGLSVTNFDLKPKSTENGGNK